MNTSVNGEPVPETTGNTAVDWEDKPNRHAYCDGEIRRLREQLADRAASVTPGELAAFGLLLERTEKALTDLQYQLDAEIAQAVAAERERILGIVRGFKTTLTQDNGYRVDAVPFGSLHDLIGSGMTAGHDAAATAACGTGTEGNTT